MGNQDLFEQAAAIVREHGRELSALPKDRRDGPVTESMLAQVSRDLARRRAEIQIEQWRLEGREAIADALLSELRVLEDFPYQETLIEERRALLAHIREWLAG